MTLHVESDRCRIPFGHGQRFTWKLVLRDPIDYTTVDSRCRGPDDSDASALVDYSIEGGGEKYCLCDTGLCPAATVHAAQLTKGSSSDSIDWPGRNWNGPSDTTRPLGAFFPIGHYAVKVIFNVGADALTASLPIEVVPNGSPETCSDDMMYGTTCEQCGPADGCNVEHTGCLPKCTDTADCTAHGGGQCVDGVCRMVCG